MAATTPAKQALRTLKLETISLTRGFVARDKFASLARDQDHDSATIKVKELLKWYPEEESQVRGFISQRGSVVSDNDVAQYQADQLQIDAESGSFCHLQQLAGEIHDSTCELSDYEGADLVRFGTMIVARERSMMKGLRAYALAQEYSV